MANQLILILSILLYSVSLWRVIRLSGKHRSYRVPAGMITITLLASRSAVILYKLRTDSTFEGPPFVVMLLEMTIAVMSLLITYRITTVIIQMGNSRVALQATRDELEQRVIARTVDLEAEITERSRVSAALSASEERMRLIVQNLPVIVNAIDANHQFVIWNREAERVTGFSAGEIVGNPEAFTLLYPEPGYRAQQVEIFEKSGGNFRGMETRLTCKDGSERVIAWSNVSGQYPIPGWRSWAMGVDITDRKRAEEAFHRTHESLEQQVAIRTGELRTTNAQLAATNAQLEREIVERRRADSALRRSENHLRSTLDALSDFVHVVDSDLRITLVNKTFLAWNLEFGLETHPIGRTPRELFPYLPPSVDREYRQVFDTREALVTEETTQIGPLQIVTETRKIPIIDEGIVTHVVTIMRDISEQRANQNRLRESEERLKRFYEHAPMGYHSLDKDGYVIDVNQVWLNLLGYERDEVTGRWFGDFLAPGYADRFKHDFLRFKTTGEIRNIDYEMVCKNGAIIIASLNGRIGYDAKGEVMQTHCVVSDITERKRTEIALRTSEERFRVVVNSIDDLIFTLDTDQRHSGVFGRWVENAGLTPDMFLGKTPRDIMGHEAAAIHEAANARALVGERVIYEWSSSTPDGELHHYQTALSPMFDEQGKVAGIVGIGRDITALKHAEQDAIRLAVERERSAILADFIRDMSHEFANPLSVIKNSAYLATNTPDPAQRKRHLEMINGQIFHIERLVQGMIMMSRLDGGVEFNRVPVSLDALLDTIQTRVKQTTAEKEQTLQINIAPDLPPLIGDPTYLHIAIYNLVENAVNYTPDGGTISVHVAASTNQPGSLEIAIADTGIGIAPEHHARIFERFFRVDKARTERGAGLGLPVTQTIIQAHGGTITVQSAPGQGSTFRVFLPILSS